MPKESTDTPGATRVAVFGTEARTPLRVSRDLAGSFLKIPKIGLLPIDVQTRLK
jgi:hypothetical protein